MTTASSPTARRLMIVMVASSLLLFYSVVPIHCKATSSTISTATQSKSAHHLIQLKSQIHNRHTPQLSYTSDKVLDRLRGGSAFLGRTDNNNKNKIDDANFIITSKSSKTSNQDVSSTTSTTTVTQEWIRSILVFAISATITQLIAVHYTQIKSILLAFFDKEKFRTSIIQLLNSIASRGNLGLVLYTFGFVFYETCGLPTSVVETAAGMAFGMKHGLMCSFIGKTCGS